MKIRFTVTLTDETVEAYAFMGKEKAADVVADLTRTLRKRLTVVREDLGGDDEDEDDDDEDGF